MSEFYQAGDCFSELKTASEQRVNRPMWREQLQRKMWCKRRDEIMKAINELWMADGSWVNIWEEHGFPGIEQFMSDLQEMGYHVYAGSDGCPEGQGQKQRRFCVYLNPIPGKKEGSINGQ